MSDPIAVVNRFTTGFLGRGDKAAADAAQHPAEQGVTRLKPSGPIDGVDGDRRIMGGFLDAFPALNPLILT